MMKVITPELVYQKKVLLRLDLDVPIENGKIIDDFRLISGLPTLQTCLDHAQEIIIMGHIGRPEGKKIPELSVSPVVDWLEENLKDYHFTEGKLHVLENLRFEKGEEECNPEFAQKLAELGEVFINESFAAYHPSASATILPKLLPSAAGLQFAAEVETLKNVRQNPTHPLIVIIGGAKIDDKLPVVKALSNIAGTVLVGGKLPQEIKEKFLDLPANAKVAKMNQEGTDITTETVEQWSQIIQTAKMIVWNGPLGKTEDPRNINSQKIAQVVISSSAETIVGGGDTIAALASWDLVDKFTFVSTGGGAMLKLLETGTLPTIEALK